MVKRKATQLYLQVQLWNRWFVLLTLNCELQQTWQANFNVGLNKIDEFHETGIIQISIPSASEGKKNPATLFRLGCISNSNGGKHEVRG